MIKAPANDSGHFHAVKFYETRESLCRLVAGFLADGLIAHEPSLVVATAEHRAGIVAELGARQFDVHRLQEAGDLLIIDASEMLADFMVDGMPDAERFAGTARTAIERLCAGRTGCTVRAYGEMVDVLWKAGQDVAAIRLEMLWNKLAMSHDFSLLCGYAMGNFYKDAALAAIRHQHSHVLSEEEETSLTRSAVH
jgi:hypothetical protein